MVKHRITGQATAMTAEKAGEVTATLNADTEDNWTYEAIEYAGRYYVGTTDEEGIFVGYL